LVPDEPVVSEPLVPDEPLVPVEPVSEEPDEPIEPVEVESWLFCLLEPVEPVSLLVPEELVVALFLAAFFDFLVDFFFVVEEPVVLPVLPVAEAPDEPVVPVSLEPPVPCA
jgi:hypothetical protein